MSDLKIRILLEAMEKISAPFKRASQSTTELKAALKGATDQIRGLEKAQAGIEAFGRLKKEAQANATALADAQDKAQKLGKALAEAEDGGTKRAQRAFAKARDEVNRLKDAQVATYTETATLRKRLAEAGIDTGKLAEGQRRLKRDMDAARQAMEKQSAAMDAAKAKAQALRAAQAQLDKSKEFAGKLAGKGAMIAAAGGAIQAAKLPALDVAGDFQHSLASYGLTAGQSGEDLDKVRTKLRGLSVDTNQATADLLKSQSILTGKGLNADDALAMLKDIGRTTTAAVSDITDMSNLGFAIRDNLKVPLEETGKAFDIMAKSGDMGGFELKNMAKYFPQLTASAAILGMTGTKAIGTLSAALQVATKGAADPSEAANNFSNFLQKATAKETVANFEKKGIDIKKALKTGLEAGENPVDVMMRNIGKAVGVDLEREMADAVQSGLNPKAAIEMLDAKFNLAEIFGDVQVANFLAPMMANMAEFRRIRAESMGAEGIINQKYKVMMDTYNEAKKGLGQDTDNALESVGRAMLPAATETANALRKIVQTISAFTEANPRLTAGIASVVGVLATLAIVGGAIAVTIAGLIGPFAMVKFAIATIGLQGGIAAGALGLLQGAMVAMSGVASTVFGVLMTGIRAVGIAFMANPIGLVIAGIAAAAALIYVYWDPITAFFTNLWDGITQAFSTALNFITSGITAITGPLSAVTDTFRGLFGDDSTAKGPGGATTSPMRLAPTSAAMAAAVAAPLAAGAPAAASPIDVGGITIHAAPGQSEAEIARLVRLELERHAARQKTDQRAALHDQE